MRDAIRGPQRSSEVLRGNQSSSEAITLWASTRSSSRASSSETQSRRAEIVSRSVEGCSNSVRRYRLPAAVLHCAHRGRRRGEHLHAQGYGLMHSQRRRGEHLHAQGYGLSPTQRHSEALRGIRWGMPSSDPQCHLVERAEERCLRIAGAQVAKKLEVGDGRRVEEHHALDAPVPVEERAPR